MSALRRFDGTAWPWSLDGDSDWYALHDATGRYVSDACVEGTAEDMRALADALRAGISVYIKRCAARIVDGEWHLYSPRNTLGGHATLPLERGAELADIIERALTKESST